MAKQLFTRKTTKSKGINSTFKKLEEKQQPAVNSPGGANSIIQEVSVDIKNPPISDGTFFADKALFSQRPIKTNNPQNISYSDFNSDVEGQNLFTPNLFGTWSDVYGAFMGTYNLAVAPDGLKRHEQAMLHLLFLVGRFGVLRIDEDNWLLGNFSIIDADNYGRLKRGSFTPWNYATQNVDEKRVISLTGKKVDMFVGFVLGNFSIPPFLAMGYYINLRNMLYQFKNVNVRLSVIHKLIGLKGQGREVMEKYLKDLFNLNPKNFPNPIQIIDISVDEENGDISFSFTDLKNEISLPIEYKGKDINVDIEFTTKELFRVAGLRTDLQGTSSQFTDRANNPQVKQASNYFDARENQYLKSFRAFEYDFKQKFGIEIKWETIYQQEQEKQQNKLKEKENDSPENI